MSKRGRFRIDSGFGKPPRSRPVRVRLYKWRSVGTVVGVVYADEGARDRLVKRLSDKTGERLHSEPDGDFPLSEVRDARVREEWREDALRHGAVLRSAMP